MGRDRLLLALISRRIVDNTGRREGQSTAADANVRSWLQLERSFGLVDVSRQVEEVYNRAGKALKLGGTTNWSNMVGLQSDVDVLVQRSKTEYIHKTHPSNVTKAVIVFVTKRLCEIFSIHATARRLANLNDGT